LDKQLNNNGFLLSKNGHYCKTKLGSLFDIDKRIPINYHLSDTMNEREILILQLKYVNEGDILIMDGGYYSKKLIGILIDRKINYIFRTPVSNMYVIEYISDSNVFDVYSNNNNKNKCKIVKYIKNNEDRYLLTNLINCSSKIINNDYIGRWVTKSSIFNLKFLRNC
jgi:hypothetical protein